MTKKKEPVSLLSKLNNDEVLVLNYENTNPISLINSETHKPPNSILKNRSNLSNALLGTYTTEKVVVDNSEFVKASSSRISSRMSISFDGLDIGNKVNLTLFDQEVIDTVTTLAVHQSYISIPSIYRLMTGKGDGQSPSASQRKRIHDSIDKCSRCRINIALDSSEHGHLFDEKDVTDVSLTTPLLPISYISGNSSKGIAARYMMTTRPPVFDYALSINKVSEYPRALYDTPVTKSEGMIVLQSYLIRRITEMNVGETRERLITWSDMLNTIIDLYKDDRIKYKLKDNVLAMLDHWKEFGFISGYSVDNISKSEKGVTIRSKPIACEELNLSN